MSYRSMKDVEMKLSKQDVEEAVVYWLTGQKYGRFFVDAEHHIISAKHTQNGAVVLIADKGAKHDA